jgi:amino acid transporter
MTSPLIQAVSAHSVDEEEEMDAVDGLVEEELPRSIGLFSAAAISIGFALGSGIFSTPGVVWSLTLAPGPAMLLWLLGAAVTFCGALCYIELGTMLPKSGGEQAYLAYCYKWPPNLLAFLFSWSLIL